MSAAEEARRARAHLSDSDPRAIEAIDGLRGVFKAKLTALHVDGCAVHIGRSDEEVDAEWSEATPYVRYTKPEEIKAQWKAEKDALYSRAAARARTSGRRHQRLGS